MSTRYTVACATCALAALVAFGGYALRPKPVVTHIRTRFERTGTTLDGWGWAAQPWTGDDRPYQKIRADVQKRLKSGKDPAEILADYKAKMDNAPKDPQAMFGWGYARWRIFTWSNGYRQQYGDLSDLPDALAAVSFPKTYNYARLRFLIQAQVRAMPQLQELGERLVRKDPTDIDAKFLLIAVLKQIPSLTQNQEAVRLTQELIDKNPKEPVYWQTLGVLHEAAYMDFGFKKSDGDKAITAFQKRLELAPPDDDQRDNIERAIKGLKDTEAENFDIPARSKAPSN